MAESTTREISLTLSLGADSAEQLSLVRLDCQEALSEPFLIELEALALTEIELLPNLGKAASIKCQIGGEHARYFHGVVIDASYQHEVQGSHGVSEFHSKGFLYRFVIAPAAHFLQFGSNYRIFQGETVRKIIDEVLKNKIQYQINSGEGSSGSDTKTRTLKYCVQYGESDFAFVSRLMEEHGLYYYYEHTENAHTMMICDRPGAHNPMGRDTITYNPLSSSIGEVDSQRKLIDGGKTYISTWQEQASTGGEQKVSFQDFDFTTPQSPTKAEKDIKGDHPKDDAEVYRYPGRFWSEESGTMGVALAQILLQSRRAQRLRYVAGGNFPGIMTGRTFTLEEHPNGRFNREYMITATRIHYANQNYRSGMAGTVSRVDFTCIKSDAQFRAPMVTPRPVVRGPETAIVTGPQNENIHVDPFGRIKVKFHWDRSGKSDDTTSCWVRVSQFGLLGSIFHPRVGEEVIIDFFDGNPDRPIVVGRVYNGGNKPIYELDKEKTKSIFRTKTYPHGKGHDALGEAVALDTKHPAVNELRFDDMDGKEEVFIHAQRDKNVRVRHNNSSHVGRDEEGKIGKNRTEDVGVDEKLTVGNDRFDEIKNNDTQKIGQVLDIYAGNEIKITALNKITLTVGTSKITIDQGSVKIETLDLSLTGSVSAKLASSVNTSVEAGALTKISGSMVKIN